MAKKRTRTPAGPTPVEAIVHTEKRANIPTGDAYELVDPELEEPIRAVYERDPSLDPQLVWTGKYDGAATDLEVEAPPIYIQEKIDPRVLIENLRQTAKAGEEEPELTLFESFDGLGEVDLVEFYHHEANWSNRMILGDSLQVMASLAERERLRGKVQMIYMDPPYGIKFGSNWQMSTRAREVIDGKPGDLTREVEQVRAFRDTWSRGIHTYLGYLAERFAAARELLSPSGSLFVQIGDANVHLVRTVLDEVFGPANFMSLISLGKTSGATAEFLPSVTDFVVWYARERGRAKYRPLYTSKSLGGVGASKYDQVELADGARRPMTTEEKKHSALPLGARPFRFDNLTSQSVGREKGEGAASWFPVTIGGREFRPTARSRWKTNEQGMGRLMIAGRVSITGRTLSYVRFLDDFRAVGLNNAWLDIGGVQSRADPKIYVVQTATRAVERCIIMTTDPGDLVLDPTCGSGTTAFVAEQWGRRWITIDTSRVALAIARQRLMGARFPFYLLADSVDGRAQEEVLSGSALPPAEATNDIRHGFVYERVPHVTLKSIANNPDIQDGMSREEINEAIRRHADTELLFDRPCEDARRVRVSGPFTVESLSPHRSLAFAPREEPVSVREAALDPEAPTFEQTVLANLAAAGIQNGRRNERLEFAEVEPFAGTYIQAVGTVGSKAEGAPSRVGIAIGPQYGTVAPAFVKDAARETIRAEDIDLVCVLGFAFDPQAVGVSDDVHTSEEGFASVAAERKLGRLPVLLVRMNADLVMGEELKKSGAGNLFTVFGEPDIEITRDGGQVAVAIRGVDVYDPTTGEIRSGETDQIALWMIDTDYNGESFFVRHCYFTGGLDPYKRLKTALKADIDEDAWASLYRTTSRPFDPPSTGRIAVKVINDYGDEVMKVFPIES